MIPLKYKSNNINHKSVIVKLVNDPISMRYLGDLSYLITYLSNVNELDGFYVVNYNDEDIGIITLSKLDDKYFVTYGLIPEYRGNHLASVLLNEFSSKIFEDNEDINELYLSINKQNIASRKTASSAGYLKENEMRFKRSSSKEKVVRLF